jgi:ribosomal protein S18 acetylase RimI-like enzyme
LLDLFASAWWIAPRTPEDVARMVAESDVVVGVIDTLADLLVGLALAITDGVSSRLWDVIVEPAYRGSGLGVRLVDALLSSGAC